MAYLRLTAHVLRAVVTLPGARDRLSIRRGHAVGASDPHDLRVHGASYAGIGRSPARVVHTQPHQNAGRCRD
jgi:hypothetical protein